MLLISYLQPSVQQSECFIPVIQETEIMENISFLINMILLKWSVRKTGIIRPMKLFNEVPRAGQERLEYGMAVQAYTALLEEEILVFHLGIGLMATRYNSKLVLKQVFDYYCC